MFLLPGEDAKRHLGRGVEDTKGDFCRDVKNTERYLGGQLYGLSETSATSTASAADGPDDRVAYSRPGA